MLMEFTESILQLAATLVALLMSLFQYISSKKKGWIYTTIIFLSSLVSSYYWTAYLVIMGKNPTGSDIFSNGGWNISFLFMLLLVLRLKSREELRSFNLLMLIPLPLNLWQLSLYLPFGNILNTVYQVSVLTLVESFCFQSIGWYHKNRSSQTRLPYVAIAAMLFSMCEFGMWTASSLDVPISNLYYPFSFLESFSYLLVIWSLILTYRPQDIKKAKKADNKYQVFLKTVYFTVVMVFIASGILIGHWMKKTMTASLGDGSESEIYNIIPVILVMISLILVLFAAVIIVIVHFNEKISLKLRKKTDRSIQNSADGEQKSKEQRRLNLLIPVIIIFFLMVCMVSYTSYIIREVAVTNIHEVGEDKISSVAGQLENYLEMTKSTLWVTADSVDYMVENGADTYDILEYIKNETRNQEQHFDENYTGIYGYVRGQYLDGVGWVPPTDYDPANRSWYRAAIKAKGDSVIVSPYLDAQTGNIIISISRMLSNGRDVLSMDVTMNHIQEAISDLHIKGKGYGYIINSDGMIIAHRDETEKGRFLNETDEQWTLYSNIRSIKNGNFVMGINDQKCTVFVHEILDQWYVVIIVSNDELFAEVWQQSTVNGLICIVIFSLIAFFYLLGHRNEQAYSRRIEEMRAAEEKKAYEAKVLKLEKEAADNANQAKSNFLADMSHEIRTPINAVLGMNEMILRESLQAEEAAAAGTTNFKESFGNIVGYSRNIESAGNNLLSIINDILDFSKIEAGRMDITENDYQLCSVMNDLSNMIFFKAKGKGLDFVIDVDRTLPDKLYGDEVRVRQVITNILNNAVKYTESGSVKMTVSGKIKVIKESEQVIILKIKVKDTGIGIHPEDKDKLFEKFQRLDLKQNSTIEGTGLGLAITNRLLRMMNGTISVESEYGKGSEFTITLPQKIISLEPIGDFKARFKDIGSETKAHRAKFQAPDAHILIVDDTKMNLTVATGLLKTTLIRIDTAGGGEEALSLTKTTPYDLILMDQRMPKMGGTEALHHIREQSDGRNQDTPVICLTADAVMGAKERYLSEGFTDYLTKPINSIELENMLAKYLSPEKIIILSDEESKTDMIKEEPNDKYSEMRQAGVNIETGLQYFMNDDDLYFSILEDYLKNADEKMPDIKRYFDEKDWDNYGILVHSVKSSSKMLGADELSEIAAKLEKAANEENIALLKDLHPVMWDKYESVVEAIRHLYPDISGDEAEIMEFMPENSDK